MGPTYLQSRIRQGIAGSSVTNRGLSQLPRGQPDLPKVMQGRRYAIVDRVMVPAVKMNRGAKVRRTTAQ